MFTLIFQFICFYWKPTKWVPSLEAGQRSLWNEEGTGWRRRRSQWDEESRRRVGFISRRSRVWLVYVRRTVNVGDDDTRPIYSRDAWCAGIVGWQCSDVAEGITSVVRRTAVGRLPCIGSSGEYGCPVRWWMRYLGRRHDHPCPCLLESSMLSIL